MSHNRNPLVVLLHIFKSQIIKAFLCVCRRSVGVSSHRSWKACLKTWRSPTAIWTSSRHSSTRQTWAPVFSLIIIFIWEQRKLLGSMACNGKIAAFDWRCSSIVMEDVPALSFYYVSFQPCESFNIKIKCSFSILNIQIIAYHNTFSCLDK